MKRSFRKLLANALVVTMFASMLPVSAVSAPPPAEPGDSALTLWYDEPASQGRNIGGAGGFNTTAEDNTWQQQTLPIGNSLMGANVYGEVRNEKLTFNHKTLWNGGPSERRPDYQGGNLDRAAQYQEIMALYEQGRDEEANAMASRYLVGISDGYGAYQSWGDILLDFDLDESQVTDYRRSLDLSRALAQVDFTYKGTRMHREYLATHADNVIAMKFTADGGEKLNFNISFPVDNAEGVLDRNLGKEVTTTVADNTITVAGHMQDNGLKLNGQLKAVIPEGHPGAIAPSGEMLAVTGADEVLVYLAADTDYLNSFKAPGVDFDATEATIEELKAGGWSYRTGETDEALDASVAAELARAVDKGYEAVKADHLQDYQALFGRLDLDLGQGNAAADKTTDQLLAGYKSGRNTAAQDRALEVLLFQYGRYMTISSSRAGDLPSNLQGVWQNRVGDANRVPWGSDYHMNVNLQMNYWPTYSTNLAECGLPIIDYVYSLIAPGRVTAKDYFGVDHGFTAHTQNTPFGWTCPGWAFSWGWSPAALPWILQNCWEYYEYTGDEAVLAEKIYPALKESALLYDQIMITDPVTGRLVSAPAYSPEHGPVTAGNTYEQSLIWQLYEDAAHAADVLGVDADLAANWRARQARLDPIEVGDSGQIKEWYTETTLGSIPSERGHRHMSHLLGLFPGDLISVDNPEFMDAAIVSLNDRGDRATGWGMGQRINAWARTGDGNRAHKLIQNLFRDGIYPNLFDSHAPFQIDGNFGYTSGVAEMLMQSNMGYINLLPALPDVWADGSVSGLLARGNFELAMDWTDGHVTCASIHSKNGGPAVVQMDNGALAVVKDEQGNVVPTTAITNDRIRFETVAGGQYTITEIPAPVVIPVPTGLKAEKYEADTALLSWDAVPGENVSYNVYRQLGNGTADLIAAVTEPAFTDGECLDELDNLRYQVSAVVDKAESERTDAVAVQSYLNMAGLIDDRDPRVKYTGDWGKYGEPAAFNRTTSFIEHPVGGETVSLKFVGTGITVYTVNGTDRGKFEMTLDDRVEELNCYAASHQTKAKLVSVTDLPYGVHNITLKTLDKKIEVDAFEVLDSSTVKPDSITVTAPGGMTTVGHAGPLQLKAEVLPADADDKGLTWTTNNPAVAEVDQNGLVTVKESAGTVIITAKSNADPAVMGKLTLTVAPASAPTATETVVEDSVDGQRNEDIKWSPNWTTWAGEPQKYHGGAKTETPFDTGVGQGFSYTFDGNGIEVYAHKNTTQAAFQINIDGQDMGTYSLEGNDEPQALVYSIRDLTNESHTITCTVVEREGSRGQGNLDYLKIFVPAQVETTEVEDSLDGTTPNPAIGWDSAANWAPWAGDTPPHHGAAHSKTETNGEGRFFTYTFNGTGVELYAHLNTTQGSYDIYLDDVKVGNYSLYGQDQKQGLVFSKQDLPDGEHTIKCVSVARDGKVNVSLDYLKITSLVSAQADKSALQDVLVQAGGLNAAEYPAENWPAFEAALAEAAAKMNDPEATEAQLAQAASDLEAAIAALGQRQPITPVVKPEAAGEAALVGSDLVILRWDAVEYAEGYKVIVREGGPAALMTYSVPAEGLELVAATNMLRVEGLAPNTNYTFEIYAMREDRLSENCITVEASTLAVADTTAPAVPADLAADVNGTEAQLTWTAPADADLAGYDLFVNGAKTTLASDAVRYTLTGLVEGEVYSVNLVAFDESGNRSVPAKLTITGASAPVVLVGFQPVTSSTTAGVAPELPTTVVAVFSDKSTAEMAVTWAEIAPEQYAAPGTFRVEGFVADTELTAVATITVTAAPVEPDGSVQADAIRVSVDRLLNERGNVCFHLGLERPQNVVAVEITYTVDALGAQLTAGENFLLTEQQAGTATLVLKGQGVLTSDAVVDLLTIEVSGANNARPTLEILHVKLAGRDETGKEVFGEPVNGVLPDKLTYRLSYDINNDGVVDLLDVVAAQRWFHVTDQDAEWASAAYSDVNGDQIVDIQDLILILLNRTR